MQLRIADEGLRLFITAEEGDTPASMMNMITQRGIKAAIPFELLQKALNTFQETCVLEGMPAQPGHDGMLKFLVDLEKSTKPKVDIDVGKVDYHTLGIYEFVKKGQRLVEIIPSTPGKDGTDIFGAAIRAENGKPVILTIGKNVVREGNFVLSMADGVVDMLNGTLVVKEILEIYHDIDYSIGNIDFNGNVIIKGNVFPNFKVISGGDILIDGIVDKAEIQAAGSVIVTGGIIGHEKASIKGNSISAKFVNQSRLYAEDIISIQGEILHSICESKNRIIAGSIIGGIVKAKNEIVTGIAGSNTAVKTEFIVGRDDYLAVEMQKIESEEHALNETKKKIALQISDLKMREVRKQLDENGAKMLVQLMDMMTKLNATLEDRVQRKLELTKQADETGKGIVKVNDVIFNNVHIHIGSASLANAMLVKHVKFLKLSNLVKMFDMDDAIGEKAKILGTFYYDQKEIQIDIHKIDFTGEKITFASPNEVIQASVQGKLVFSHPIFNDKYELDVIVAGRESSYLVFNMRSFPQRRIEKKKNIYYGELTAQMVQLMVDSPAKLKVVVDELHENALYIKSENALLKDSVYECVLDVNGMMVKLVIKPYGNSLKTRTAYETKCYIERVEGEDMLRLKKLLNEGG